MISAQLYENDYDKSTPLLAESSSSSSTPSPSPLTMILRKYKKYSVTIGCLFGLCVYMGTAVIVSKFVQDDRVDAMYENHLPLLLFGSVWTTAILLASVLLVAVLRTLMNTSETSATAKIQPSWQSVLIILLCCFILGFECGAGVAWVGFLGWRRPISYNIMFAVYFFLICILTGWALQVEDEKLEADVASEQETETTERTARAYEPLLIV